MLYLQIQRNPGLFADLTNKGDEVTSTNPNHT